MVYIDRIILALDPFLIAPYRWADNTLLGWWIGTFVLALWAAILGELTLAAAYRINRTAVKERLGETEMYQQRSLNALKSGDKPSYKAINKLANEAFGKSFFLMTAMGMSSLWPAFLAAAWAQKRFGEIRFPFPFMEEGLNFVPYFVLCYVLARILVGRLKRGIKGALGEAVNRQATRDH